MSNWAVQIKNSANVYVSDGNINRPNEDLETERISTSTKVRLADGSDAFMTPEIKELRQPFNMFFANTTAALRTKIQNYISNSDDVKIVDHNSGTFIGKFTSMKRVWFIGISDTYDIMVQFTREYDG